MAVGVVLGWMGMLGLLDNVEFTRRRDVSVNHCFDFGCVAKWLRQVCTVLGFSIAARFMFGEAKVPHHRRAPLLARARVDAVVRPRRYSGIS